MHAEGGSAQFRKVWKFEVVDKAQVPEDYKLVNAEAISFYVRNTVNAARKESTVPILRIAGIRFYQEEQLAVSGG